MVWNMGLKDSYSYLCNNLLLTIDSNALNYFEKIDKKKEYHSNYEKKITTKQRRYQLQQNKIKNNRRVRIEKDKKNQYYGLIGLPPISNNKKKKTNFICSSCKQLGHKKNQKICPNFVLKKKIKKISKCSACGGTGHSKNHNICPLKKKK